MRQTALRRKSSLQLPFWYVDYLSQSALHRDVARVAPRLQGSVLDLGCGNSPYRSLLTQTRVYVPYDIDATGSLPQVVGIASVLPFRSASFDGVLCTQVLEHVEEPARLLAEVARVLCAGGTLVLSAPQMWRMHEQPYDFYRYTKYGLEYLLRSAGLEPVDIWPQGGAWRAIGQSVNNALWQGRASRYSAGWLARVCTTAVVNLVCAALDSCVSDTDETLNYVVVARKA